MNHDPHGSLRDTVLRVVLEGPGVSDPALRAAAAERNHVPSDIAALVDKIHQHAYKVTDEDVATVQRVRGDDETFEIIVSASLGASRHRLRAGLAALEAACD